MFRRHPASVALLVLSLMDYGASLSAKALGGSQMSNKDDSTSEGLAPDTTSWMPRKDAATSLSLAFRKRCAGGEEHLRRSLDLERSLAIDTFDSGVPFETAVREEIGRLIPSRYEVKSGIVVDRNGSTAGQVDAILFNGTWFVPVNAPIATQPARILFPIEGAYAVGEVKQKLTKRSLDEAMEKLVTCHRLPRPRTFANRLVENREGDSCEHGLTNPLFSFVIAGGTDEHFERMVDRFFYINRTLARHEVISCMCILGVGTVSWAFRDPLRDDEIRPARFMRDDLFHPIFPVFTRAATVPPLLSLVQSLQLHLFHSVLGPEDIAVAYGFSSNGISMPKQSEVVLPPDNEWIEKLKTPCTHD